MKFGLRLFAFIILSAVCFSQPKSGNVGISAMIQGAQSDLQIPVFYSDQFSAAPSIGLISISDKYTDLSLGAIMRYYISKNTASPFIGARLGAIISSPKNGDGTIDLVFGPLVGGEYYFSQNFSAGVEMQLNISKSAEKSMRFNNPDGTNINTATALFVTYYF